MTLTRKLCVSHSDFTVTPGGPSKLPLWQCPLCHKICSASGKYSVLCFLGLRLQSPAEWLGHECVREIQGMRQEVKALLDDMR